MGGGICRTKKLEIRPEPKHPKNVPKGPRRPPGPPQKYKTYFLAPLGPSRALFGPTGPKGALYNSRSTSYAGLYWQGSMIRHIVTGPTKGQLELSHLFGHPQPCFSLASSLCAGCSRPAGRKRPRRARPARVVGSKRALGTMDRGDPPRDWPGYPM